MAICTDCPHNGKLRGKVYERSPCAECDFTGDGRGGDVSFELTEGMIEVDAVSGKARHSGKTLRPVHLPHEHGEHTPPGFLEAVEAATDGQRAKDPQEETFSGMTVAASDALRDFMRQWMALHSRQRDVIAMRIAEPDAPLKRIADVLKISVQAVHQSLQRAAAGRNCPALLRVPLLFNRSDLFGGNEALRKARAATLRILQEHGGSMIWTELIQKVKTEVGVHKAAVVSIDRLVGEGVCQYSRGPTSRKAIIQNSCGRETGSR